MPPWLDYRGAIGTALVTAFRLFRSFIGRPSIESDGQTLARLELIQRFQHIGCVQFANSSFYCPITPQSTTTCFIWRTKPHVINETLCEEARRLLLRPGDYTAWFAGNGTWSCWIGDFTTRTIDPPSTWPLNNTLLHATVTTTLSAGRFFVRYKPFLLLHLLTFFASNVLLYTSKFLNWRATIGRRLNRHGSRILQRRNLCPSAEQNERTFVRYLGKVIECFIHPIGFRFLTSELCGSITYAIYHYRGGDMTAAEMVGYALLTQSVVPVVFVVGVLVPLKVYESLLTFRNQNTSSGNGSGSEVSDSDENLSGIDDTDSQEFNGE